jgi:glycosyltransferase involved in cell wall biosynthesis
MRIVVDMQGAQTSFSGKRGVGRYTMELVKAIALNPRGNEIILALNGAFPDTIETIRSEFSCILSQKNIKVWQQFFDTSAVRTENVWRKRAGEILREEFLNDLHADIIFSTNLQEGLFDPACTSAKICPTDSLICSTLHDVTPMVYPDICVGDKITYDWYQEKIDFIKKSDIVLTVSQYSQGKISEFLGIPLDKIHVIYNAVDHKKFRPKKIGFSDKKEVLARMNISYPFVMYAGGSDSFKNLDTLYSAFSKLPKDVLRSHQLVIVGEGHERRGNHQRNKLEKLGISGNVVFVGRVEDEELVMLYNLCELFVFPSLHEGFGLPPLEAMSCGAAVLASNASSLPEVVGCQEASFDPHDADGLAAKIEKALIDTKYRELLISTGIQQSDKFSWKNSAESLLKLFEDVVNNRDVPDILSEKRDPIQSIVRHVALISSSLAYEDNDLVALSASIAETFCYRKGHKCRLFVDVSSVIIKDDLTGIQRVVRAICNELISNLQEVDIELVYTMPEDLDFFKAEVLNSKISRVGETRDEWVEFCQGDILLFLDLHPSAAISHIKKIQYLRNKGVFVYHVVYDILPALKPEFFWPDLCTEFHEWLLAISNSDGAICISRSVADELAEWLETNGPKRLRPFNIGWFHLGADVEKSMPSRGLPDEASQLLDQLAIRPSFLMVGTIEPRKGQAQTIAAFEQLWAEGVNANLVILGKMGWNVDELLEILRHNAELGERLFLLEGISDEYLEKIYAASTCLIAASEGEGFGLPLIEAAQHCLPIIARDIPVFQEVAGEHAYYFSGKEPADLAFAINEWLALYKSGQYPKSDNLPWLTWKQSTKMLLDLILNPYNNRWSNRS